MIATLFAWESAWVLLEIIAELAFWITQILFFIYAVRVYVNSLKYGAIQKWIAVFYSIILMIISLFLFSIALHYTHWCTAETTEGTEIFCMMYIVVGLPFVGGPGLCGFGFIFLLVERTIMMKKYGKSRWLLRMELHPKIQEMRTGQVQEEA
jgi:hypothetical protein